MKMVPAADSLFSWQSIFQNKKQHTFADSWRQSHIFSAHPIEGTNVLRYNETRVRADS
jgi:hypothetical protein